MKKNHHKRGVALILALSTLVLITVLVLAIISSVGVVGQNSKAAANNSATRALVDDAIQLVTAQIRDGTTLDQQHSWASQPGMIRTYNSDGSPSNYIIGGGGSIDGVSTPTHIDDGSALLAMPCRWIYVRKSGYMYAPLMANGDGSVTIPNDPSPTAPSPNPIVRRIAFWTDDDTCKVNINTACGDLWSPGNIVKSSSYQYDNNADKQHRPRCLGADVNGSPESAFGQMDDALWPICSRLDHSCGKHNFVFTSG